ncbi:MAG TPA: aldo/keto reductase [Sphingomonadaceae bacterium]|nr:aldo/keto reductase [Sphingomonadaceae bacterium]
MTQTRPIGTTGLSTLPLVLGGNVFGWTASGETAFAVLDAFVAGGGTLIDTADFYSAWIEGHKGGESEQAIGAWLARRGRRDDVQIATKVGMLDGEGGNGLAPARIVAAAEASLKRLGTDYIDLYYAHQDDESQPQEAVLEAFDRLVKAGKVRAIAASNFTADRLGRALDISEASGIARYGALQPHFNLLERGGFPPALQQLCIDRKLGVLPYFGLASGFLTGKYRSEADLAGKPRGGGVRSYLNARGFAVLAAMDAVAADTGASLPQIALAWIAAQPGITAPIASATSVPQVEELLGATRLTLTPDHLASLDEAGGDIPA